MKLENNGQLRNYLISLSETIRERGATELAQSLISASNLAWTWPATEFLGESRIALRRVLAERIDLGESEMKNLRDVLAQLDAALERR